MSWECLECASINPDASTLCGSRSCQAQRAAEGGADDAFDGRILSADVVALAAADVSKILEAKPKKKRKTYDYSYPGFEEFWVEYPLKLDKYKAAPAFAAAVEAGADAGAIIAGARRYAAWVRRNGTQPQHVKYAQGWLNDRRWEDDLSDPNAVAADTTPAIGTPEYEAQQEAEWKRLEEEE